MAPAAARGPAHLSVVSRLSAGHLGMLGLGRDGYIFILLLIAVSLSCDLPKVMQSPKLESWNLNLGALVTKGTGRSGPMLRNAKKDF